MFIATYLNSADGVEARIAESDYGYTISVLDVDSSEVLPTLVTAATLEAAIAKAKKIAGVS